MRRLPTQLLLLLVFTLGVGLLVSRPSIDNPWYQTDLHLIRDYTSDELASVWTGYWDPDREETAGFRPLQTWSNHLRYRLLGESPAANRYVTVAAVAVALTLLAWGLKLFGVPLAMTAIAGLIELTSKNFSYTWAAITDGYHAFQMVTFGLVLVTLGYATVRGHRRRLLLSLSVLSWAVTLLFKEQAVALLPVPIALALLWGIGGSHVDLSRDGRPSYGALFGAIRTEIKRSWAMRDLRLYVCALVAVVALALVARAAFVEQYRGGSPSPHYLFALAHRVVSLSGGEFGEVGTWIAYWFVAAASVALVVLLPRISPPGAGVRLARPWLLALLAGLSAVCSTAPGVFAGRADLVYFPLYFYALFLSSSAVLLFRVIGRRPMSRRLTAAALAGVAFASTAVSVRASVGVQRGMGSWSVQTLAWDYLYVYILGAKVTIPHERRQATVAKLRRVGIDRRIPELDHDSGLTHLYCLAKRDRASPAVIPKTFAFEEDDGVASGDAIDAAASRCGS